jgi:chromosomal replication initiation ATPase DnaA
MIKLIKDLIFRLSEVLSKIIKDFSENIDKLINQPSQSSNPTSNQQQPETTESVVKQISEYYNLDERIIYEKTRRKEIVKARQMIMFVLREDFNESYPSIGSKLGGKDHTTVIHSYEKIKNDLTTDPVLMKEIAELRSLFT